VRIQGAHVPGAGLSDNWMSGLSPLSTLIGLSIAVLFALVAWRSLYRGLQWFAALAAIPIVQVAGFSGQHMTQGLMMSEVLATVLILVYFAKRHVLPAAGREITRPLLAFIAVSCVSLITGHIWYDPAINTTHLNVLVSVGQILLFCWPIGIFLVTAGVVTELYQVVWLVRLIQGLSLLQPAMAFVPAGPSTWLAWTWYFGLFAAPFSFAEIWETHSWMRRAGLAFLAFAPIAKAIVDGRAFIYVSLSIALLVVCVFKLRRNGVVLLPALAFAYALFVVVSGSWTPATVTSLIEVEREQRSFGGPTGRGALLADAISIWERQPLLGVGPGNSYPYMLRYSTIGTPHNQYANILLELGAAGLIVFMEFIRRAIKLGLRIRREAQSPAEAWVATGWLGLFIGLTVGVVAGDFMFHSIRNGGILFFSQFYLQWILLGAVVSLDHRRDARRKGGDVHGLYPWTRHRTIPSAA
jgi:hypothetical protein